MTIQVSRYTILVGAGFTKNFGAPVASEMWNLIADHEIIQTQKRIKKLMQYDDSGHSFESLYHSVIEGFEDKNGLFGEKNKYVIFTSEEKEAIKKAILFAYEYIDEILITYIEEQSHKNELTNVFRFISSFLNSEIFLDSNGKVFMTSDRKIFMVAPDKNKTVFIFSLNQDLFFERAFSKYNNLNLYRPWIKNENLAGDGSNKKLTDYNLCELPNKNELYDNESLSKGKYLLLKLHGSYDCIYPDGSRAMIIGKDKKIQIQKEPLLNLYFELFKKIILQGQRRLIIVGYGFGDSHINRELSKAVKCGLKIYILSQKPPQEFKEELSKRLKKSEDTINIFNGISDYFQVKNILSKEANGNEMEIIINNISLHDFFEDKLVSKLPPNVLNQYFRAEEQDK